MDSCHRSQFYSFLNPFRELPGRLAASMVEHMGIWVEREEPKTTTHGFPFFNLRTMPCLGNLFAQQNMYIYIYISIDIYIYICVCNIASGFVVTERQSAKLLNCNESNEYLLITGVSIQIVSLFPHIDSKFLIVAANPNPNSSMVNLGAELV